MARTATMPPLPFDVRLAQAGANVLFTLLAIALLGAAMWWLARLPAFNLRGITVEGDLAPYGPPYGPIGLKAMLEAARKHPHWTSPLGPNQGRGVACGCGGGACACVEAVRPRR